VAQQLREAIELGGAEGHYARTCHSFNLEACRLQHQGQASKSRKG